MKSLIITVLMSSFVFLTYSQEEESNSFKPNKGNFTFEVNFTPFNLGNPIDLSGFRGRIFLDDKLALRTGVNFANVKNEYETPANTNNDLLLFDKTLEKATIVGVNLGVEFHFLNSNRISPYAGFEVGFENKSSSAEYENYYYEYDPYSTGNYQIMTTEYENSWRGVTYYTDPNGYTYIYYVSEERAYTNFSISAVLGTDVYIVKHLYMGFELGFGYNNLKYKEVEVKVDGQIEEKIPEGTENLINFKVNNAIRLGVWF